MKPLAGRRVLITGGSRGVGAATAQLFAEWGAHVVIGYRARKDDADAVIRSVRTFGVRGTAIAADVCRSDEAGRLVSEASDFLGGLDCFIGNAGIWIPDEVPLAEMAEEQWERTMRANLDAIFYTTRAAARVLQPGGRVVLVSSTAGQRGEAYHADYAASKGAMISLVKSLCVELAPRDITVNCVAPGWIDTEMVIQPFGAGGRERIAAGIPLGRVATAHDIAGPIAFLCSDLARHITGEVLNVNGGSVLPG